MESSGLAGALGIALAGPVIGLGGMYFVLGADSGYVTTVIAWGVLDCVPPFIAFILGIRVISRIAVSREELSGYWVA